MAPYAAPQPQGDPSIYDYSPVAAQQGDPNAGYPQDPGSPFPGYSDPGVTGAQNTENLGFSNVDSALKAARERAIINFGDPALADMAGFGLDPQAAAFARQNYLSGNSTLSRLDKSHGDARKAVIDKLASHGLLFSGDTGYQTAQADQGYSNQVFDARQHLLGYLSDLYQSSLDRKQSLRDSLLNAYTNAYQAMLSGQ